MIMGKQEDFKTQTLKTLNNLEKQVGALVLIQQKNLTGYDYINVRQLSELLGMSEHTIYTRVHQKQIPYYKPGGKVLLFKTSEIMEWINSSRHSPIQEIKNNI